jgi:anti-sigma factor RsiW
VRCELADALVDCYFDGELTEHHAAAYERHLQYCVDCSVALVEQELLAGCSALSICASQTHAEDSRESALGFLRRAPLADPLLAVVRCCWRTPAYSGDGVESQPGASQPRLRIGTRRGNYRYASALTVTRTDDRNSFYDEQVVKQWFDDRVNFDLPVRNYANEGFALQGGRLDEIEGRSVAAVVYEGGISSMSS